MYTENSLLNDELIITRGNILEYVRISIHFEKKGEVCINIYDCSSKLIGQLLEDMKGYKKTPAGD